MNRDMATKRVPLAELPNGRLVYEDDYRLDLTNRERVRVIVGHLVIAVALALLVVGVGFLESVIG